MGGPGLNKMFVCYHRPRLCALADGKVGVVGGRLVVPALEGLALMDGLPRDGRWPLLPELAADVLHEPT